MHICRLSALLIPCFALNLIDNLAAHSPEAAVGIGILDAVRSTLQLHPLLQFQQRQVDINRAVKQQRSGAFDTLLDWSAGQSRTNSPLTEADRLLALQEGFIAANQATNLTTLNGGAQRLLRSGILIGPHLEMDRITDNLLSRDGISRTRLSFDVTVPLWRGKGREVVTAFERSAQINVEASLYDLNETTAELILSTATNYWQYVGSLEQLGIITGAEERGREFVDSVQTLINADKLPRNEINQVQANFASRAAFRFSFEQQVAEARNNLGLAMGLSPTQLVDLPRPSDPFPNGENQTPPSITPDTIRSYIDAALKRRADFLSAEKKTQSADVLRKASRNNLHPRLDLTFTSGYAALREGRRPDEFLGALFANAHGPDAIFGLNYSFPPANNLALGQIAEAEATYQQALLSASEKSREIANSVSSSLTAVYSGIERLKRTRQAVEAYQAALEGEKDKLRLGVGSLTDMLTVESRLTDALLDRVSAQLAYAVALVQFRFASGTLIAPDATVHTVQQELFYSLPLPGSLK